jgi:hypothetical protein
MIPATEYTREEFSRRFPRSEIRIIRKEGHEKSVGKVVTTYQDPDSFMNDIPPAAEWSSKWTIFENITPAE